MKKYFRPWILLLGIGFVLLTAVSLSRHPLTTLFDLVLSPVRTPFSFGNLLAVTAMLTISGTGIAVAMTSGSFNLGGEGQAYLGSLLPVILLLSLPGLTPAAAVPLAVLTGIAGGGAMAWISGILRQKIGADELISSYLVSGAAIPVIDYLIAVPLRDPDSYLLSTPKIAESFRLARLLPPSQLTSGLFLGFIVSAGWFLFNRFTLRGYELRLTGANPRFASLSGIATSRFKIAGMTASGALCGLAGALTSLGAYGAAVQGGTAGLGWNGIAVALIARYRPALILPAALFFAYLTQGFSSAVMDSGVSAEMSLLLQAVVFIVITAGENRDA